MKAAEDYSKGLDDTATTGKDTREHAAENHFL